MCFFQKHLASKTGNGFRRRWLASVIVSFCKHLGFEENAIFNHGTLRFSHVWVDSVPRKDLATSCCKMASLPSLTTSENIRVILLTLQEITLQYTQCQHFFLAGSEFFCQLQISENVETCPIAVTASDKIKTKTRIVGGFFHLLLEYY